MKNSNTTQKISPTIQSKASFNSNSQYKTIQHTNSAISQYNSWSFLQSRRENRLNSMFNARKNRLSTITKANKVIYQRINTQQSPYSQVKMLGLKTQNVRETNLSELTKKSRELTIQKQILGPIKDFKPLLPQSINCLTPTENKKLSILLNIDPNRRMSKIKQNIKTGRNRKAKKQNKKLPQLFTLC